MLGRKPDLIGILGLGIIGRRIARVLRDTGSRVYVWNRTPVEEPNFLGSPEDIARHAPVIQIFLKDGPACLSVLERLRPSLTPAHIVINSSSIHPDETRAAADTIRSTGARYVEAPFTGSREAAGLRKLNYYVSGDSSDLAKARPILEKTSAAIVSLGETLGTASFIKIATNVLSASIIATLSECVALLELHGIKGEWLEKALEVNANHSGLTKMKLPAMLQGDYDPPHFNLLNMLKDIHIASGLAALTKQKFPMLKTTVDAYEQAESQGRGPLDFSAVALNYSATDFTKPDTNQTPPGNAS